MKIIQLTDLHLTESIDKLLYGLNPYSRLELALQSILKSHSDAGFIVITGDLADDASPKVYELLFDIIKNYKIPIYPMMGNHDDREAFKKHFLEFSKSNFIQYEQKIDNRVHIFLDTLVQGDSCGKLCPSRITWLKDTLDRYSQYSIYLYMHHHPIESGLYEMDNDSNFRSSDEFWNLLKNYTNIKHISFGHLHRIMHSTKHSISMHSTRSTTFQVAYQVDNKAEFLTNEENPTYAILDIQDDDNVRIHHHEYLNEDRFYKGDY